MRHIVFVCILLGVLSACTNGGILHEEKKYTPLYLYYDPFQPVVEMAESSRTPAQDYPNYLNYPNDWAKHGLRGCVALVSYIGKGITYSEFNFDKEGKLIHTGSYFDAARRFAEVRYFKYNSMEKLEEIYRNRAGSNMQEFEYDATGKLVKREGGMSYARQIYTYYDDGTLKEITPQIFSDHYYSLDFYGKMKFNESGELASAEFMKTSNPFFGLGKSKFRSLCTFSYASNGLCTNKNETMYYKETNSKVDSICCRNTYTYNNEGDVVLWEYLDAIYKGQTHENTSNLKFKFEYKYDKQGNWTTMKIILPNFYIGNRDALAVFAQEHYTLGQLFMGVKESNEPATITIERQINYHALPASDV